MAKAKSIKHPAVAVRLDEYQAKRVQTLSVDIDRSTEDISELSNVNFVEQSPNTPVVSVTLDTNEYGHIDTMLALVNRSPGLNAGEINIQAFDGAAVDITIPVKKTLANGTQILDRTDYINNAVVNSLSISYDVGGVAAENYSLEADNFFTFTSGSADLREIHVASGTYTGSTTTFQSSIVRTGYIPVRAYIDNTIPYEISNWEGYDVILAGSPALESSSRIRFLYRPSGAGTNFPALNTTGTGIGGIRKGQVDIYMYSHAGGWPTSKTLRLQSVSFDADFGREALEELGNVRAFERSVTYPLNVDVSVEALDSDLEEWAEIMGSGSSYNSTANEYGIDNFRNDLVVAARVYNSTTSHTDATLQKYVYTTGCNVVSASWSQAVGSRATRTLNLKSSNLVVSGGDLINN